MRRYFNPVPTCLSAEVKCSNGNGSDESAFTCRRSYNRRPGFADIECPDGVCTADLCCISSLQLAFVTTLSNSPSDETRPALQSTTLPFSWVTQRKRATTSSVIASKLLPATVMSGGCENPVL